MAQVDAEKLRRLAAYTIAWRTAHESFFAWIEEEYARRLERFERDRATARAALNRAALSILPFKRGRLGAGGRGHERAKWKFRRQTDRILEAVVADGISLFGARGAWNRAGIYIGQVDPALRRLALKRIREALREAADAADTLLSKTEPD